MIFSTMSSLRRVLKHAEQPRRDRICSGTLGITQRVTRDPCPARKPCLGSATAIDQVKGATCFIPESPNQRTSNKRNTSTAPTVGSGMTGMPPATAPMTISSETPKPDTVRVPIGVLRGL